MNRLPTVFVSHGAPTWAIEPGVAGPRVHALAERLPRPRAVVIVSPHWMTRGVQVTGASAPETVHDFGGFPSVLYTLRYPAVGDPALAARVAALLRDAGWSASVHPSRGLDHGAWVPLRHMYPDADVPVVQVSMPHDLDAEGGLRLGAALAPLAGEGVLVVGSGSLTHNLREFFVRTPDDVDYVSEFVGWARDAVRRGDLDALRDAPIRAPHFERAHPTDDHWLPLLVAAGAAGPTVRGEVVDGGVVARMLSMDAFVFDRDTSD
ncbi:MAG: class III extradiol ring-cleavage dioxygenase [Burkholderiales bacterium]|jgi:4,5-DOPA dioxygenase extradiol